MAFGTQKNITLDLYNNKYVSTRVSQYDIDSRDIIIQITDNGVPYKIDTSKVLIKIKIEKKKKIKTDATISFFFLFSLRFLYAAKGWTHAPTASNTVLSLKITIFFLRFITTNATTAATITIIIAIKT